MSKKILLGCCLLIGLIATGVFIFKFKQQNAPLPSPLITQKETPKKASPSTTYKDYTDSSGFTFSYPDNLSITNNEIVDNSTYADMELSSKEVDGSLVFEITDSKYKSLDEWLKQNKYDSLQPKEEKLGNLKAVEIQTGDRLILGAIDQGIFFNIEMPSIEKDYWMNVYTKVLESFSFAAPENTATGGNTTIPADDVAFEGEEIVE